MPNGQTFTRVTEEFRLKYVIIEFFVSNTIRDLNSNTSI